MAYTKTTWANTPSTSSPINATNLNNMETGIEKSVNAVETGWTPLTGTFTYASADSPTFVMNTSVDLTGVIGLGMRIKLTQTTVKYFIVTAITSTTITMYGGTDYTLANAAISNVYYSMWKAPFGFPLNREKWSVVGYFAETLRTSPVAGTWYNIGTYKISVPIGNWDISYEGSFAEYVATTADHFLFVTLSTTNNGESDTQMTAFVRANALQYFSAIVSKTKSITRTTKADYFLNEKTSTALVSAIEIAKNSQILIKAVCGYL